MPAQPVLHARALGDEVAAVIAQQPDLHRLLIQIRRRERERAVLDDRSCDRERVDRIRLSGLTLAAPGGTHPMRRHTNDALTSGDKALLKAPRDVPAILDRPHPLVIQIARPATKRTVRRTALTWGAATLLSSHAEWSSRGDGRQNHSQPGQQADEHSKSQPAASPRTNPTRRTSPPDTHDDDSDSTSCG